MLVYVDLHVCRSVTNCWFVVDYVELCLPVLVYVDLCLYILTYFYLL